MDTAVATPLLDTLVLATAVASTDVDTATAVATDTMVKKSAIAGVLYTPEVAGVSALSYLTAGYHIWQQKNQNCNKYPN